MENEQLERDTSQGFSISNYEMRARPAVVWPWANKRSGDSVSLGPLHERAERLSLKDVPQLTVNARFILRRLEAVALPSQKRSCPILVQMRRNHPCPAIGHDK